MAQPTVHLRFVLRSDEDKQLRILQQWHEAEGWEHESILKHKGFWEDIPFSAETPKPPGMF